MSGEPQVPPEPLNLVGEPHRWIELDLEPGGGREARIHPDVARRFTSVHVQTLPLALGPTEGFTATPPGVAGADLERLDAEGRVRLGARVNPGDLLVGAEGSASPLRMSPEQRTVARTKEGAERDRDRSLRCPPDVRGFVSAVEGTEKRVEVTVRDERPLAVGDLLRMEDGAIAVVGAIGSEVTSSGLVWPGVGGRHRVEKIGTVDDVSEARSIGPYSLVTQQPLGDKSQFGGQWVGPLALGALLDRGARALVHELLTVKADDIDGRFRLYESIVNREPRARPTIPELSRMLEAELRALGFEVSFEEERPRLRLLTTERIRALAPHEVTKPETLNYRTLKPEKGGLFCTEVFGDFAGPDRRRRLGRIELPVAALLPWARVTVCSLLGITADELERWLGAEGAAAGEIRSPLTALREALERLDVPALEREGGERGALAKALVAAELRPTDLLVAAWPVLPPDLRPLIPLAGGRFATSDLNDLYRRLINRSNRLRRLLELEAPEVIIANEEVMLQQALDTLVHNGRWSRTVVGPNRRPLVSLGEIVAGPEGRFARLTMGKRVDYSGRARAVERAEVPAGRVRVPREMALELFRPFVYADLERRNLVTTLKSAKKLVNQRHPEVPSSLERVATNYPILVLPNHDSEAVLSLDVEMWDEPVIALAPSDMAALHLDATQVVKVLVPVDREAVEEARSLIRRPPEHHPEVTDDGWISRAIAAAFDDRGELLLAAALRGEVDSAESRKARLVLGRRQGP